VVVKLTLPIGDELSVPTSKGLLVKLITKVQIGLDPSCIATTGAAVDAALLYTEGVSVMSV
jgi:hypothetical protein